LNVQFKRGRIGVMKQKAALYTDGGQSDKSLNV